MLSQPITDRLGSSQRILLAGCGGGYDVMGAVPLVVELLADGRDAVLANHSFSSLADLPGAVRDDVAAALYRVPADAATPDRYCPEAWIARYCKQELGREVPMWAFAKSGARPLRAAYDRLVAEHDLDAIVLIDGGIDALLRGDESSLGTPAEDLATLAAVSHVDVPTRLLACVGMGAEMRDGICHEQVFTRIAELTARGAYLGCASLLGETPAGAAYLDCVELVFANQASQRRSHVHKVVSAAVRGEAGNRGQHVWLSPLLNLYWFFDLPGVAETHLFLEHLEETNDSWEVTARVEGIRKSLEIRDRSRIPI